MPAVPAAARSLAENPHLLLPAPAADIWLPTVLRYTAFWFAIESQQHQVILGAILAPGPGLSRHRNQTYAPAY
ncbi:hypothetical protein VTO73DRAFT_14406 [Trametes versicolor]